MSVNKIVEKLRNTKQNCNVTMKCILDFCVMYGFISVSVVHPSIGINFTILDTRYGLCRSCDAQLTQCWYMSFITLYVVYHHLCIIICVLCIYFYSFEIIVYHMSG